MFGTILVSMSGIVLPVLVGSLFVPRGESQPFAAARREQGPWVMLRQCRMHLGRLSAAVHHRHLTVGGAPSSTVRYG
jgi:hypothetical protein